LFEISFSPFEERKNDENKIKREKIDTSLNDFEIE
jgi:hypothetical protein